MDRRPLAYRIADMLENWILQEKLRPGDPIVETTLAKQQGVSQGPVREALRILEQRGVVAYSPNRGSTVIEFSDTDVHMILQVRIPLEAMALTEAREHGSAADKVRLHELLDSLGAEADKNDLLEYHKVHWEFHRCVWLMSGNTHLANTLERLCTPLWAFYRHHVRTKSNRSLSGRRSHTALVAYVTGSDQGRDASVLAREHFSDVAGFKPNRIVADQGTKNP